MYNKVYLSIYPSIDSGVNIEESPAKPTLRWLRVRLPQHNVGLFAGACVPGPLTRASGKHLYWYLNTRWLKNNMLSIRRLRRFLNKTNCTIVREEM